MSGISVARTADPACPFPFLSSSEMLSPFPPATNAKHTRIALRQGDSDIYVPLSSSLHIPLMNQREMETILSYHSLLVPKCPASLRPRRWSWIAIDYALTLPEKAIT